MRYRKTLGQFVVLLVSLLAANASAQIQGDGVVSYYRFFILHCDSTALPLEGVLMNASLSEKLVGRAVDASKTGVSPSELVFDLVNQGGFQNNFVYALSIRCEKYVDLESRQTIWEAVIKELEKTWDKAQDNAVKMKAKQQAKSRDRLAAKLEISKANLARTTNLYIELQVATGTSTSQIRNVLQNTIDDRRRIEMELVGVEAEREALAERIASLRDATNNAVVENEICRELKKILGLREKALERTNALRDRGTLSEGDANKAKEAVAAATVDYLKARQEASRAAGGDELAVLNRKLAELGMQIAKEKAILIETKSQFDELKEQLANQLRAEVDLNQTKQEIELLDSTVRLLSKKLAAIDVDVDVDIVQPVTITPWGE